MNIEAAVEELVEHPLAEPVTREHFRASMLYARKRPEPGIADQLRES